MTRAREQAGELARALEALGAEVLAVPTIRIVPLADLTALRTALTGPAAYDWIVFTSQNTVHVVCDRLPEWGLAARDLARMAVAAIGPATAQALARYGVTPFLVPRAREARDALPEGLRARGAVVDVIPVYETMQAAGDGSALAAQLVGGTIDVVTLTSSSTVRGFVDLVGRAAATSGRFTAAVIGPVTAASARELGLPVAIEAEDYTVGGLVAALVRHFEREAGSGKRET